MTHDFAIYVASNVFQHVTMHQTGNAAGELHDFDASLNRSSRLRQSLSVLTRNCTSDLFIARFEQILAKMGVDKKLRELGVREGDTVRIAGVEFDYS